MPVQSSPRYCRLVADEQAPQLSRSPRPQKQSCFQLFFHLAVNRRRHRMDAFQISISPGENQ